MTPSTSTHVMACTTATLTTSVVQHQGGNVRLVEPVVLHQQQTPASDSKTATGGLEACNPANVQSSSNSSDPGSVDAESGTSALGATAGNLTEKKGCSAALDRRIHKDEPNLQALGNDNNVDEVHAVPPDYFALKDVCQHNRIEELTAILFDLAEQVGSRAVWEWFTTLTSPEPDVFQKPLHTMVDYASPEFLQSVLENFGNVIPEGMCGMDVTDDQNRTPLHRAAMNKNAAITNLLIDYGASVNVKDLWGASPYAIAMGFAHREKNAMGFAHREKKLSDAEVLVAGALVRAGAAPSLLNRQKKCCPDLCHTVADSNMQLLALLLVQPNVNTEVLTGGGGRGHRATPLLLACISKNKLDYAALLLRHGADVNNAGILRRNKTTPLHIAAGVGNLKVIRFLLRHNAAVNKQEQPSGDTPLHTALLFDPKRRCQVRFCCTTGLIGSTRPKDSARTIVCYDIATLLIRSGASIHITNAGQKTALHIAAESGLPDVVQLLLDHHASPAVLDGDGNSPITLAERAQGILSVAAENQVIHARQEDYREVLRLLGQIPTLQGLSRAAVQKIYTDEQLSGLYRIGEVSADAISLISSGLRALALGTGK